MRTFKVGDYVLVISKDHERMNGVSLFNKMGIVRTFDKNNRVGVEFFEKINGHNLDNAISNNQGWYLPFSSLIEMKRVNEVAIFLQEE